MTASFRRASLQKAPEPIGSDVLAAEDHSQHAHDASLRIVTVEDTHQPGKHQFAEVLGQLKLWKAFHLGRAATELRKPREASYRPEHFEPEFGATNEAELLDRRL